MAVLNESGARLGTVKRVQMGDPGAVTTAAEAGRSTGYGGAMAIADARGDEPEVPGRCGPRRDASALSRSTASICRRRPLHPR